MMKDISVLQAQPRTENKFFIYARNEHGELLHLCFFQFCTLTGVSRAPMERLVERGVVEKDILGASAETWV